MTTTQAIAFTVPLLPAKTEQDRSAMRSCSDGPRRDAHRASRERLGITAESVWIQPTPAGDVAVVHLEAEDLQRAFAGIATSVEPFDQWFREHCLDVHGLDLTTPIAPPEQVLDFRA